MEEGRGEGWTPQTDRGAKGAVGWRSIFKLEYWLSNGIFTMVVRRSSVLIVLLLLQSISSSVLTRYEKLISANTIIPLFLTMLVGAGGNAGNQAAVRAISGIAAKEYTIKEFGSVLMRESCAGFICATLLTAIGYLRVYFYTVGPRGGELEPILAISISLWLIVFSSTIIGSALPFIFEYFGADREHAGPTIQVIMDILGVCITCIVCFYFLG